MNIIAKIKKNIILFFLFALWSHPGYSQDETLSGSSFPTFDPVSPETSRLFSVNEVSGTNLYNGRPDIKIPLFNVRFGSKDIPVSLSYSYNGLDLTQEASPQGLGWVIDFGGSIHRIKNHMPDEYEYGGYLYHEGTGFNPLAYKFGQNYSFSPTHEQLENAYWSNADFKPDLFCYTFPGYSGSFMFDENGTALPFIDRNLVITDTPDPLTIPDFHITTPEGNTYQFNTTITNLGITGDYDYTTDFFLSKMISYDKKDTISISYNTELISGGTATGSVVYVNSNPPYKVEHTELASPQNKKVEGKIISRIKHPLGTVIFYYGSRSDQTNSSKLDSIRVEDNQGKVKKKIVFDYSYFNAMNNETRYLKMNSLTIHGTGTAEETFSFDYEASITAPSSSCDQDYWGYYNGRNGNSNLIPTLKISGVTVYSGANRVPNAYYSKLFSIKSMTYPTGGKAFFTWEANEYSNTSGEEGPGIRICSIFHYDPFTQDTIKHYIKYGTGAIIYKPTFYGFLRLQEGLCYDYLIPTTSNSDYIYICDHSLYHPLALRTGNGFVGYDSVTDSLAGGGYTKYEFTSNLSYAVYVDHFNLTPAPVIQYGNQLKQGKLTSEVKYNNQGQAIQKHLIGYQDDSPFKKLRVVWTFMDNVYEIGFHDGNNHTSCEIQPDDCTYSSYEMLISFSNFKKIGEVFWEKSSGSDNAISDTKRYYYDSEFIGEDSYLFPTRIENKVSNGDTLITKLWYPFQYSGDSGGIISSLMNTNRIAIPLEKQIWDKKNLVNYLIKVTRSKYDIFGDNDIALPEEIWSMKISNPVAEASSGETFSSYSARNLDFDESNYRKEIAYAYDDNCNPVQITTKDGLSTSYLWDGIGQYPIAKVINASYDEIKSLNGQSADYSSQSLYNSLKNLVSSAMINTYSYDPLIGMTSSTDPNGVTTYYEYDDFGRLKNVRNDDEHITARNFYHYYSESITDYPTLAINKTSINFTSYTGGSNTFNITANCNWTISSNSSWLSVSSASGSGNKTITVTATQNSTSSTKTGTLTITYGGHLTKTIVVYLAGYSYTLTVSPTSLTVPYSLSDFLEISISSNTSWTVSSDVSWLSFSPSSGTGDKTVTVTVAKRTGSSTGVREATITVSGGGITRTISVTSESAGGSL